MQQIISSGIDEKDLLKQLDTFEKGISFTPLNRACTIGDGIMQIPKEKHATLLEKFELARDQGRILKFVPASGAASRMFKALLQYVEARKSNQPPPSADVEEFGKVFISSLEKFAFYDQLMALCSSRSISVDTLTADQKDGEILHYLLTEDGLNLANLPKGLVPFHKSDGESRTPFIEHLVEAREYALDSTRCARVHFTVPPQFQSKIAAHIEDAISNLKREGVRFEVSYSIQKESSQTIAVDMDNNPVRTKQDLLVFRPSGHGALIENLNEMSGDIVFIKNIDNVVPDSLKEETYLYKKLLAGVLLEIQENVFNTLSKLESSPSNTNTLAMGEAIVQQTLGYTLPSDYSRKSAEDKGSYLFGRLNRPIRVCGMVKNQGEPGGGPFWLDNDSNLAPQIVESAQVDMDNQKQKEIFSSSTHFNPVDLICGIRDYKGERFNLLHYVDYDSGLITAKSKGGKELKALELPGLWNGAMAHWNTLFVEVPLITFNPVKTINDLLRPEHQA